MLDKTLSTGEETSYLRGDETCDLSFKIYSDELQATEKGTGNILWNLSTLSRKGDVDGSTSIKSINLSSSSSLFSIRGRSRYYLDGIMMKDLPFEVSLNSAKNVAVVEEIGDGIDINLINTLRGTSKLTLRATDFNNSESPITALTLSFITGEYETDNIGYRSVLLCKGTVEMKNNGDEYIPGPKRIGQGGVIVEHLIDRIILLTGNIDLPTQDPVDVDRNKNKKVLTDKKVLA